MATKRRRRRKKKPAPKFDLARNPIMVLLSCVSLIFLVTALATETGLSWAAAGVSTAATSAYVYRQRKQAENKARRRDAKPHVPETGPGVTQRVKPKPSGQGQPAATPGVVKCTETGKPIDKCSCASRHVATPEGARTFGGPIGRPLGKRAKGGSGKVPMTSRAKPQPQPKPGEAMVKDAL